MERFFPADRITMTGNPLRGNFSQLPDRAEALKYFGFTPDRPVLMVVGGSLGSRTFNNMMKRHAEHIATETDVQVIWQTGKLYEAEIDGFMADKFGGADLPSGQRPANDVMDNQAESLKSFSAGQRPVNDDRTPSNALKGHNQIWRRAFIDRMDMAYAAADLVISRSGAITVSELCLLGKPVMFVPSPNVAEDHQTKNAMALVEKEAAEICPDHSAVERAIPTALDLIHDRARLATLAANIRALGIPDSADRVATEILNIKKNQQMKIENIYFLGIGGIGMSALARFFLHAGKRVAG
jgi:UDP-N-acetylglucosamine--N-acetylmuramyl-(pentapeptide) pyrophosphoryl-undecaprenol N-acetylglucosamine transferase